MKELKVPTKIFKVSLRKKESVSAYVLLSPVLVFFTVFTIIPMGMVIYLSFTKYSVITSPQWVGLQNYKYLFFEDEIFKLSLINTVYFVIGTVFPAILCGLLFAIVLNRDLWGKGFFRSCIYLPYITPVLAAALVWMFLYEPTDQGFFNYLVSFLGVKPIGWLSTKKWAMPSIIFINIWRTVGYFMILFLAGLQGIPKRYYEAASIDGANRLQEFWYITLPLLKPVTSFVLIIATIQSFQIFQEPYIMTEGGPAFVTTTIVYWFYIVSFQSLNLGKGSAISFILMLIIFVISIGYLRALRLRETI